MNNSVRIDARSKENMLGNTQRFGDFSLGMRWIFENKMGVLEDVKRMGDEEKEKIMNLFLGKTAKMKFIGKSDRRFYGEFSDLAIEKRGNKSLLDVGCSVPKIDNARVWKSYTGIDLYESKLREASQILKEGLIGAEATYLPFKTGAFDFAVAYGLIPILGINSYFGIVELARVAKEGIAFTVGHLDSVEKHIEKMGSDGEILGLPKNVWHRVEFDLCTGIFMERGDGTLSVGSGRIYFGESDIKQFLGTLGFGKVETFVERWNVVKEGEEDREMNAVIEVIALRN